MNIISATNLYDLYLKVKQAEATNVRVWFQSDFRRSGMNTRLVIGNARFEWHTDTVKQEEKAGTRKLALNAFSRSMWVRATDNGFTCQEVLNTILRFEDESVERKYAIDEILADLA